ncbi:DNA helicase RecQ [Salisaeta longa]|uniref:DNA helicase RecQ n=1 Tax=Salisaeta longa TaxID=503170 RepID=UPI0003B6D8B6|nr:DNA helicase RecQ [Salisaeta longa]
MPSPVVPSRAQPADVLQSVFGHDTFRPYQERIVRRLLNGQHAVVIMPTGGGKSLCYQLPALMRDGVGIVVSPLIALMEDQVAALRQRGVSAAVINSGQSTDERRAVEQQLVDGTLDLCYVAPERIMRPRFQRLLHCATVALLAIDEAHCISQWGHDFRPEYLQLSELRTAFPEVPCIAVTATADAPTQQSIVQRLHLDDDALFVAGFDRPNIRYTVVPKRRNARTQLLRFLNREHPHGAGIVYCLSRKRVEQTAEWLSAQGRTAVPYHAGLSDEQRAAHQERFLHADDLVVVATVAFGMGINKPDVRFVAHLDVPKTLEAYYQETGRAGRDGEPASAWMAYRLADIVRMHRFIDDGAANDFSRRQHQKLDALFGYCESTACRRTVLLGYFDETYPHARCDNCDNCLQPPHTWQGTEAAQKVLSCIARTEQRFGAAHIADVLTGSNTKKIRQHGHDALPTHGVGDNRPKRAWRSIIRQLVAKGLIRVDMAGYGALQLDPSCAPVLRGETAVELRRPSKAPVAPAAADSERPSHGPERDLFDALRETRAALAKAQEVPPYVIFHDKTLWAMVEKRPATLADFRRLPGVGDMKQKRYGPDFLEALADF